MRKENFMIAFINKDILDIRLPWWVSPFIGKVLIYTYTTIILECFDFFNFFNVIRVTYS